MSSPKTYSLNVIDGPPKGFNRTEIQWADHSMNPVRAFDPKTGKTGWACVKVSPGCANCYAENLNRVYGTGRPFTAAGMKGIEVRLDMGVLRGMLRSKPVIPAKAPDGVRRVFWEDMSDIGGEWMSEDWLIEILAWCAMRPDYEHMLLTKRPAHVAKLMRSIGLDDGVAVTKRFMQRWYEHPAKTYPMRGVQPPLWPIPNVRWGTSIESQKQVYRAQELQEIPASGRFISFEPLLSRVDVRSVMKPGSVQLFIVGGESGRSARPFCLHWARSLRDQARELGAAFFMKQMGGVVAMHFDEWNALTDGGTSGSAKFKLGHGHLGRWKPHDSSGGELAEFPDDLQIREWPAPLGVRA